MVEKEQALKIRTDIRGGFGILYPTAHECEQRNTRLLEDSIRRLLKIGCHTIVLSFRELRADHAVLTGIIILCQQFVKKHKSKLVLLKEGSSALNSFDELCFFLEIGLSEKIDDIPDPGITERTKMSA